MGRRKPRAIRGEEVAGDRLRAGRAVEPETSDGPTVHRAFRRMAFLFANLVCGIWLLLLTTLIVADSDRPDLGSLVLVLLVSAPIAYAIPYALIRLAGLVMVAVRRRRQAGRSTPEAGSGPE